MLTVWNDFILVSYIISVKLIINLISSKYNFTLSNEFSKTSNIIWKALYPKSKVEGNPSNPVFGGWEQPVKSRLLGLRATRHIPQKELKIIWLFFFCKFIESLLVHSHLCILFCSLLTIVSILLVVSQEYKILVSSLNKTHLNC